MENQPKLNSSKEESRFWPNVFPTVSVRKVKRVAENRYFSGFGRSCCRGNEPDKTQLRSALRLYTSSWRYLYVLNPAQRVSILTATHAVSWTATCRACSQAA